MRAVGGVGVGRGLLLLLLLLRAAGSVCRHGAVNCILGKDVVDALVVHIPVAATASAGERLVYVMRSMQCVSARQRLKARERN